ncbi:MAG: glucuronate isomerase [Oscillospiraceae bacterium]|nr:glucuronate isomerase [Oscillospiraceae bacterium]
MRAFMGEDFLLTTDTAQEIFHYGAEKTPIFDWHCHLSPKEIYENRKPADLAELWLGGDHYKWRAMRSCGIDEKYITGDSTGYEKFLKYAETLQYCIGNPLYHWTHLELQRYFDVYEPLNPKSAPSIWQRCNNQIEAGGFTPRELIEKSNVACVCTTDDAADSLEYHKLLAEDKSFKCKVLPAFRPDKSFLIDTDAFVPWIEAMEKAADMKIDSFKALCEALAKRIDFFDEMGCRASDHALAYCPYAPATDDELEKIFKKALSKESFTLLELDQYRTALLRFFGAEYAKRGWVMELHLGAMRNNNTKMFNAIGADTGFDSIDDREIAHGLSRYLDSLAVEDALPKTVLFTLNPKDNYVLGTMLGNFQSSETPSKIQFGSAWWFNDNYDGMREQMKALSNLGVLGKFIGMVTDSRSFLSYPRHEYFRRILCELLGDLVEDGKYPCDIAFLSQVVADISFNNAKNYFGLKL